MRRPRGRARRCLEKDNAVSRGCERNKTTKTTLTTLDYMPRDAVKANIQRARKEATVGNTVSGARLPQMTS